MRNLLLFGLLIFSSVSLAASIKYRLSTPKPQDHYFQVEMELDGFKEKELLVKMPVWAPGSYLVREFAKNLNQVLATDENGSPLLTEKIDKNTWKISKGKAKTVKVNYEVYAFELSVRTSFFGCNAWLCESEWRVYVCRRLQRTFWSGLG